MLSVKDNEVWYSEVKSGEHKFLKSINKLNIEKINLAYNDLSEKLSYINRNNNYWITAKMKLNLCLDSSEEIERIGQILSLDMKSQLIKNKIVVSVIFGKSSERIDKTMVEEKLNTIRSTDEKVIIVCIRENTVDRTISIIEELASNG